MLSGIQYEPKKNNRFAVRLPEELNIPVWCVNEVSCPKMYRHLLFFSKWEDIEITFLDFISNSTSHSTRKNWNKKNFTIFIERLDPVGEIVESWEVKIKRIKSIDFGGKISYYDDGLATVKVKFKVSKCTLLS